LSFVIDVDAAADDDATTFDAVDANGGANARALSVARERFAMNARSNEQKFLCPFARGVRRVARDGTRAHARAGDDDDDAVDDDDDDDEDARVDIVIDIVIVIDE